jgi:hypothetical protein
MLSVCLCNPPINFWTLKPIFIKPGIYICIYNDTWAINPSQKSVCLYVYVARQMLCKKCHCSNEYTCNNKRIVGRDVFYAARVISKENLWVCLCIPLSLLGNNSVKTFPWQQRIVGCIAFSAVRVVSKDRRRLVLPRTSCFSGLFKDYQYKNWGTR